jgi:hypothetical protein
VSDRLLRLSVRCPCCGAPPKLRTLPEVAGLIDWLDGEAVILTYECHVRRCGERYEILVRHLTDAA